MTPAKTSALDLMTGTALTNAPVDRERATAAIRAFGLPGLRVVLDKRRAWLEYQTVTQRRWQCEHTRRAGRARHLDSLSIREGYVRCH